MPPPKYSIILITSASVMVALGDLRNAITPLGYWLLWGAWSIFATISLFLTKANESKNRAPGTVAQKLLLAGFSLLLIGFMSSAIYNSDPFTLYQTIKLVMICAIGILIHKHSARIGHESIFPICLITVWISFGTFLLSKFFLLPYHVVLGDGRQGSLIAYPGVLWKTGAFFSMFALAHFLSARKLTFSSILVYIIGIYLIILDGSRTGFLWIALATGMLFALRILALRQSYSFVSLLAVGSLVLAGAVYWAVTASMQVASMHALPFERLSTGDSVRTTMLHDSLIQAERCLPVGCGFGTAVTDTTEGPMVVHNAYLATLADVGVVGLAGFLLVILGPFIALLAKHSKTRKVGLAARSYMTYTAALGVAGFGLMMTLHPLSTEMSEWGLFFLMSSWMFSNPASTPANIEHTT